MQTIFLNGQFYGFTFELIIGKFELSPQILFNNVKSIVM